MKCNNVQTRRQPSCNMTRGSLHGSHARCHASELYKESYLVRKEEKYPQMADYQTSTSTGTSQARHLHIVLAVCDHETHHSATVTIRLERYCSISPRHYEQQR